MIADWKTDPFREAHSPILVAAWRAVEAAERLIGRSREARYAHGRALLTWSALRRRVLNVPFSHDVSPRPANDNEPRKDPPT